MTASLTREALVTEDEVKEWCWVHAHVFMSGRKLFGRILL